LKTQFNFVCLKFGDKYTELHVNRLYNSISKHLKQPFTFYCITDNNTNLNKNIHIIDLDMSLDIEGCMWKICIFNELVGKDIPLIYFDLDVVLQKDPAPLFKSIQRNKITACSRAHAGFNCIEFNYHLFPSYFNSSMMGFYSDDMKYIYETFINHLDYFQVKYHYADDRFISNEFNDCYTFFDYSTDYYFRRIASDMRPTGDIKILIDKNSNEAIFLLHDPEKIVCIVTDSHPYYYEGLEEYFI